MRAAVLMVWAFLLTACTTSGLTANQVKLFKAQNKTYEALAAQPTPSSWHPGATWGFRIGDEKLGTSSTTSLQVTDEPAKTCMSGEWKSLHVVKESAAVMHEPAYLIEGRNLRILVWNLGCDRYDMLTGTIDDVGFVGSRNLNGLRDSTRIGPVEGKPLD